MLAGAGFGAVKALEAQRERRLRELQVRQAAEQATAALAQRTAEANADNAARLRTLDLAELKRRDENNVRGLELMNSDRARMDTDAAIAALPSHLKPLEGLMRIGAVGKLSPDDLEDPNVRATREAKTREQAVQDQIRIRQASRAPRAEPAPRKQVWVKRGGAADPIPIEEGTAQAGDVPFDPVAARSSQPANQAEAQDTAREAKRLATALLDHKGFNGAFGLVDSYMPTFRQSTADAESIRDALTSLLTLENTGKLKGVLSNTDMQILRQASSTLNSRMSESAARAELRRIIDVMGRASGEPAPEGNANADPKVLELIKKYGGGG